MLIIPYTAIIVTLQNEILKDFGLDDESEDDNDDANIWT